MTENVENYRDFSRCHEIASLKDFIQHCLLEIERLDPHKRIIFILDSLDQLTPDDYKNIGAYISTFSSLQYMIVVVNKNIIYHLIMI